MKETTKLYFNLCIAIVVASGIAINGFFIAKAIIKFKTSDRSIMVKGLAERIVKSDTAELTITFKNVGNNLLEIQNKSNQDKKIILNFLKSKSFNEEEITLDSMALFDRETIEYESKNKKELRYIGTNSIKINTKKVDLIQEVVSQVDQLITQQITINVYSKYYFTKFADLREDMIAEATKSARKAAMQFAKDSGANVGEIQHATQGAFSITSLNEEYNEISSLYKKIRVVTTINFNLLN